MDDVIGGVLRARRKEIGKTIKEIAQAADVHLSYLSEVETGRRSTKTDKLSRILIALEMPYSTFWAKVSKQLEQTEKKKSSRRRLYKLVDHDRTRI
jgi:transcriptional regulator with XRE-family HTH domain